MAQNALEYEYEFADLKEDHMPMLDPVFTDDGILDPKAIACEAALPPPARAVDIGLVRDLHVSQGDPPPIARAVDLGPPRDPHNKSQGDGIAASPAGAAADADAPGQQPAHVDSDDDITSSSSSSSSSGSAYSASSSVSTSCMPVNPRKSRFSPPFLSVRGIRMEYAGPSAVPE